MTLQTWILAAVFVSVSGLTYGISLWATRGWASNPRMGQLHDPATSSHQTERVRQGWQVTAAKIAAPIARLSAPKEGWEASNLRVRFMHAGLRGSGWPTAFFTTKTLLAVTLPALLILFGHQGAPAINQGGNLLPMLLLATMGYYFPNALLSMTVRSRQRELREALPDAVDLMTVCVEAGLGLDAALLRAGEEMNLRSHALADELNLMTLELRIGSTRAHALQNLALRTGVDDIATFVTTLLQSEHFGTNVAQSLRVLAETMRDQRRLRAEESAAKIPLKLLFPLIFFIFPSLLLVLMGPAVMSISRTLIPTLGGGH
jgi:tight adherence protein C